MSALLLAFPFASGSPVGGGIVRATAGPFFDLTSKVCTDRETQAPRGFGFVTFTDARGLDDAIAGMNEQELGSFTPYARQPTTNPRSPGPVPDRKCVPRYPLRLIA